MKYTFAKIILLIALAVIAIKTVTNLNHYLKPFDYSLYADRYQRSQYVLNRHATNIISDEDLYSYAGYYYITGGEVSRVNFENPPLGKYLIGVSILMFNNQQVIYLLYGLLFLLFTYKFGMLIFKNPTIAAFGVLWTTIDPYFTRLMSYPMLDLPMALFFSIGFYYFLIGKRPKDYFLTSLFFGLSFATKFFPALVLIVLFLLLYQWVFRRKFFMIFLVSLVLIPVIYCLSCLELILRAGPIGFVEFQWWMLKWRTANPIVLGNALESIFLGRYRTWWDLAPKYNYYSSDWTVLIPLQISIALYSVLLFRKNRAFMISYMTFVMFFIYMNVLTEGSIKYLITIYVFLALFTAATVYRVLLQLTRRKSV